ncbi:MAG: hypothetical protein PVF13_02945 [Chromatiales bacterium]|jgi:hypothetical protein
MTETSPDSAKVIVDRLTASQEGLQEVETAILKSLQTYSETVNQKMDQLVQLNLPSESESKAAEEVREAVLTMTTDIIRMVKDSIPKPNSSS